MLLTELLSSRNSKQNLGTRCEIANDFFLNSSHSFANLFLGLLLLLSENRRFDCVYQDLQIGSLILNLVELLLGMLRL